MRRKVLRMIGGRIIKDGTEEEEQDDIKSRISEYKRSFYKNGSELLRSSQSSDLQLKNQAEKTNYLSKEE